MYNNKLNLELQSSTNATIVAAAKITGESAEKKCLHVIFFADQKIVNLCKK